MFSGRLVAFASNQIVPTFYAFPFMCPWFDVVFLKLVEEKQHLENVQTFRIVCRHWLVNTTALSARAIQANSFLLWLNSLSAMTHAIQTQQFQIALGTKSGRPLDGQTCNGCVANRARFRLMLFDDLPASNRFHLVASSSSCFKCCKGFRFIRKGSIGLDGNSLQNSCASNFVWRTNLSFSLIKFRLIWTFFW